MAIAALRPNVGLKSKISKQSDFGQGRDRLYAIGPIITAQEARKSTDAIDHLRE